MNFPTSGEIQSFLNWLDLAALEGLVLGARPDLDGQVAHGRNGRPVLTVELPDDRMGYDRRVVLGGWCFSPRGGPVAG